MAKVHKFTTTTTGAVNERPVAVLAVQKIDALIGSIIQLDGRQSYDPEKQPITWHWRFVQVPIGSEVETAGFREIRPRGTAVSFIPDKTGIYIVELIVNDGELDSTPITATINIQLSRVPVGENLVPDAHFLWSYISNFWQLVEDREVITSIWSSVIQLVGVELISLWGRDLNKSLSTIQGTFQRRWQSFSPTTDLLDLLDQRIIVGKNNSGTGGASGNIGEVPGIETTQVFYKPLAVYGPLWPAQPDVVETDFTDLAGNYGAEGRIIVINGEGYTLQRTSNQDLILSSDIDMTTTVGTNQAESVGLVGPPVVPSTTTFISDGVMAGDRLRIKTGDDAGEYLISNVVSETELEVTWLNGSPVTFIGSVAVKFEAYRPYTVAVADESAIPDGQVGAQWRIPNLLHTPGLDLEEAGVRTGDVLVFDVTRGDIGLTAELRTQVVGVDRKRLGFELSLAPLEYDGEEIIDRELIKQLVLDLKIVRPEAPDREIAAAAEALISFIPTAINLNTRQFSTYRITFTAKKIIHNNLIVMDDDLVSVPALQEQVKDPPVVLRENLDYIVEGGNIEFVGNLFTPEDPAPESLWAEMAIYDNGQIIENNFGRLIGLSRDDLVSRKTRAPYLSAVKGLFFAYTNGPTVANIRLGLQILLGLPFAEERGIILEVQDNFTTDVNGNSLGRLLVEDVDASGRRIGFRRIYYFPTIVGLEVNPSTGNLYAVNDVVEQFAPLSKGVEVQDYIKDPDWWVRALFGAEVLKFFTFKIAVDSEIFEAEDIEFAFDFVRAIKPAYTKVISTAVRTLYDDVEVDDVIGGSAALRFYENTWGLEATNRADDDNQQGAILMKAGSKPFATRIDRLLYDVKTEGYPSGGPFTSIRVFSDTGWDVDMVRARSLTSSPVIEGDILVILKNQPGSSVACNALYEIGEVIDANTLELLAMAPATDPDTYVVTPMDPDLFDYGTNLVCTIIRRMNNPMLVGADLETTGNEAQSASADFLKNAVGPGDHLIIETGANRGEYIIDQLPSAPPATYISDTELGVKNLDGTDATLAALTGQAFRVISPVTRDHHFENALSVDVGGGYVEIRVLDSTSDPFEAFSPGMIGQMIEVANSENPLNDGKFQITDYVSPGAVQIYHPAGVTETVRQARVYL